MKHPTNRWERREKKLENAKKRIPKHGKSLGQVYKNAIDKRNKEL